MVTPLNSQAVQVLCQEWTERLLTAEHISNLCEQWTELNSYITLYEKWKLRIWFCFSSLDLLKCLILVWVMTTMSQTEVECRDQDYHPSPLFWLEHLRHQLIMGRKKWRGSNTWQTLCCGHSSHCQLPVRVVENMWYQFKFPANKRVYFLLHFFINLPCCRSSSPCLSRHSGLEACCGGGGGTKAWREQERSWTLRQ